MSHHIVHTIKQLKDKTHRDNLHVDLVHTQKGVMLPKLAHEERVQHSHGGKSDRDANEKDSLFRIFKDQNTIDILRHKNINEFKHKVAHQREEDFQEMMREIQQQKDEIIKEMKIWTKISEYAFKGEVTFSQNDYSQLHNAFYKWLLFIEESYSSYEKIENSLPPPLLHQSPNNLHSSHHYNEEIIRKSTHVNQAKIERQSHKLEIQRLNLMIKDLQGELQAKKVKILNKKNKIEDLELRLADLEQQQQKNDQKIVEQNKKTYITLTQSQEFLQNLKTAISEGKDCKIFLEKLSQTLLTLKEYKQRLK